MSDNSTIGKIVGICFMILWCGTAFAIGSSALSSGAPFIFALVPFGMALFGIVVCIGIATGQKGFTTRRRAPYRTEHVTYTGDSMTHDFSQSPRYQKSIYQVPGVCPSCGASISTETVDWVGPLQAKCPYCNATIDAEERTL